MVSQKWIYGGDEASLIASIREGRAGGDMPAFKGVLTDTEIRTLVLTLRDRVIAPVLAGVRKPVGRPRNTYTRIDRDYDTLRYDMRALFTDLGIATAS